MLYRYILNYLRTGKLIYPKENKTLAKELFLEATFYQIRGIQKVVFFEEAFQNSSFIINNLTVEQKHALVSWLPSSQNFANWVQLYSAQANGWSTPNFHQFCDNKGPTVIIAKAGNYIFGGYADVSWNSSKNCRKLLPKIYRLIHNADKLKMKKCGPSRGRE